MSATTEVITVEDTDQRLAQLALTAQTALAAAHGHADALYEAVVVVGAALGEAHRLLGDHDWSPWLAETLPGVSTYGAFVLMKATAYPDLLRDHKPTTLEGVQKLLPQGQGTAYDREQAECARRLRDSGMTVSELRVRFSAGHDTIDRWLNPESYEAKLRAKVVARARKAADAKREGATKRAAAIKAKGGTIAAAYGHVRKAAEALQAAHDEHDTSLPAKRAIDVAQQALYDVEDAIGTASRLS